MDDTFAWLFRYLHIMSGVIWVGGAALWTMIIAPNVLQRGPPPIRRPFLEAVLAKFTRMMMASSVLTILTGFVVMGIIVGWDSIVDVFQNGGAYGIALGVGVVAAIVMTIEGFAVIAPTGKKLLAKMQSLDGPPTPEDQAELGAMGKKVGIAGLTSLVLGFVALGAMVWAVNAVRGHV